MPALLIAFVALAPAGALLVTVNLHRLRLRLDEFGPGAPRSWGPSDRDSQRQDADVRAARDRWDARDTQTDTTERRPY